MSSPRSFQLMLTVCLSFCLRLRTQIPTSIQDGGKEEMHRADIDDHTQEGENYKQVKIQMKSAWNWTTCQSLLCHSCACMCAYVNRVLSGLKCLQCVCSLYFCVHLRSDMNLKITERLSDWFCTYCAWIKGVTWGTQVSSTQVETDGGVFRSENRV